MKSPRNIARIFSLTLTLAGLMSWNTLPIHSSRQIAQAATNASLTKLTDQQISGVVANGKIAFVSASAQGNEEINTMNPDGSDRARLTFAQGDQRDYGPAWSPDGTQIAFVRTSGSSQRGEILVMNADGSNQRSLTPSGESDYDPAWSPDGTQIVFVRRIPEDGSRHNQIHAMNSDGSNQRRLTHSAGVDDSPTWSPDGTKVAFSRFVRFASSLVVMNADGSEQRIISQIYSPVAWSPDSSKLAFASIGETGIFVVNVDGGGLTPITYPPLDGYDAYPSWSPDGSKITFTRFVGCDIELANCGSEQIWVEDADGTNRTKLIDKSTGALAPTWSPDGTKIIFWGSEDLFVMNADGSGVTNITNTKAERETSPSWQSLLLAGCADSISPAEQSFEATGGTGSIDVAAASECSWAVSSNATWISVPVSSRSGKGSVIYSVAANSGTSSRRARLIVAGRIFSITQAGVPVRITSVSVAGKKLFLFGENFDDGAVILLNGEEQRTRNDDQNPQTALIGKKTGKKVKPGDKLQVRNPNGTVSQEFTFAASA